MNQTKLQKAIEMGFTIEYFFSEFGKLFCYTHPEELHTPSDVVVGIWPCAVDQHTLYLLKCADGRKGIAILLWEDPSNHF